MRVFMVILTNPNILGATKRVVVWANDSEEANKVAIGWADKWNVVEAIDITPTQKAEPSIVWASTTYPRVA